MSYVVTDQLITPRGDVYRVLLKNTGAKLLYVRRFGEANGDWCGAPKAAIDAAKEAFSVASVVASVAAHHRYNATSQERFSYDREELSGLMRAVVEGLCPAFAPPLAARDSPDDAEFPANRMELAAYNWSGDAPEDTHDTWQYRKT